MNLQAVKSVWKYLAIPLRAVQLVELWMLFTIFTIYVDAIEKHFSEPWFFIRLLRSLANLEDITGCASMSKEIVGIQYEWMDKQTRILFERHSHTVLVKICAWPFNSVQINNKSDKLPLMQSYGSLSRCSHPDLGNLLKKWVDGSVELDSRPVGPFSAWLRVRHVTKHASSDPRSTVCRGLGYPVKTNPFLSARRQSVYIRSSSSGQSCHVWVMCVLQNDCIPQ